MPTVVKELIDATGDALANQYPNSYPANTFKNISRCRVLENALKGSNPLVADCRPAAHRHTAAFNRKVHLCPCS